VLGRLSGIAALLPGLARELCVSVDEILTTTMDGV
jgi:hypothetical protein